MLRTDTSARKLALRGPVRAFHVGYNLFLVRTYRAGDLGQTYPIVRGTSPLLVSLGAAVFASERPDPISLIGIVLISSGIISLAFAKLM